TLVTIPAIELQDSRVAVTDATHERRGKYACQLRRCRSHCPRVPEIRMSLANLLSVEQIIPEMKATERWAAIVELIDLLVSLGKIKPEDRDPILASLKQREETMSTGIGFGIAIPHCSSDRLEEVVAAFGRSTTGIEFDALDNAPVKFVVLFIVPKNQFQTHLRTLASI